MKRSWKKKLSLERDLAELHMLKIPSCILATTAIDVPN
jgi:hypothetical protein